MQTVWTARAHITSRTGEGLQVGFGEATATPAVSQLSSLRRVYTGAWQKGHMSGSGTMTWPDGHLEAAMARGVRKWRKFKFEDEINRQNEAQEIGDVNRICDDRQSKKLGVRFQVWGWVQEWLPPWSWNPHLARWFWDPVASPQVKTWTSLRL